VETRLLVDSVQVRRSRVLLGKKRSIHVNLEAFGDLVLEFELTFEDVGRRPGLSDGQPMLGLSIFGLNVTMDGRLQVADMVVVTSDLEGDVGGSLSFDLDRGALEREVFAKQIVGRLAEILRTNKMSKTAPST
jgi:hypothetical protein